MSELKEWTASEIEEYDDARLELAEDGKIDCTRVYIKSDVDAAIAELKADYKEACGMLQTANLIKDEKLDELRHHKYKRCLAMAKLCNEKWLVHNFAEFPTKLRFYDKWHKRWLKIAEKYKPNKEAK